MSIYDRIILFYPELTEADFAPEGSIALRNDADDFGDYIEKWSYSKPIPDGLQLGK